MKQFAGAILAVSLVSACAAPAAVDFNGNSVKIRTSTNSESDRVGAQKEATRICGKVGKSTDHASTTYIHDLNIQHHYLCI